MQITVLLVTGDKLVFPNLPNSVTVGRSPKSDVVIPHDGVSRQHCRIENSGGDFFVTDLESTNGVYIDGKKITPNLRSEIKGFLPLSFGPVQSLLIEDSEEKTGTRHIDGIHTRRIQNPLKEAGTSKEAAKVSPKASKKKKVDYKFYFINFLIVLFLGMCVYYFMNQEQSSPAPELEPSSSTQSSDTF